MHCSDIDIKPVGVNKSSPSIDKFVRAEPPFSKNAISPVSDTSTFLLMFNEVNLGFPFPRSVQDKSLILQEETLRSFKPFITLIYLRVEIHDNVISCDQTV